MFVYKKPSTVARRRVYIHKTDRQKERLKRLKQSLEKWTKPLSTAIMQLWNGQISSITVEDVTKAAAAYQVGKFVYEREMAAQAQQVQNFAQTVLTEMMSINAAEEQAEVVRDFPKVNTPVSQQSFENWLQSIDLNDFDYQLPSKPAGVRPAPTEILALPEQGTAGLNYEEILGQYIERHTGEFINDINSVQQANIKKVIRDMDAGRYNMNAAFNMIANSIGLTERDFAACEKYYFSLRQSIAAAHPEMSGAEINTLASQETYKFSVQKRRERADRIARTEIAAAHNNAYDLYIREAQRQGLIGKVVLKWVSAREGVCEHCARLDGQVTDIDGEFKTDITFYGGQKRLPPAHPNCRCIVQYIEADSPQAKPDTNWYDKMSRSEKKAFHNKAADREQWKRYIDKLGKDNVPETLEKFQEVKYNENQEEYTSLKTLYKEAYDFLQEHRRGKKD